MKKPLLLMSALVLMSAMTSVLADETLSIKFENHTRTTLRIMGGNVINLKPNDSYEISTTFNGSHTDEDSSSQDYSDLTRTLSDQLGQVLLQQNGSPVCTSQNIKIDLSKFVKQGVFTLDELQAFISKQVKFSRIDLDVQQNNSNRLDCILKVS